MSDFSGSGPSRTDVRAIVKWFNPTKGFGFVKPNDGSPDAFLHVSVLEQLGRAELPEGAEILCDLSQGRKGLQVAAITRIESMPTEVRPELHDSHDPIGPTIEGRVKFFNVQKGFGFIVPDDGGRDVFVSARILARARLQVLLPDQRVRVRTRMGQKGPMAETLELA